MEGLGVGARIPGVFSVEMDGFETDGIKTVSRKTEKAPEPLNHQGIPGFFTALGRRDSNPRSRSQSPLP